MATIHSESPQARIAPGQYGQDVRLFPATPTLFTEQEVRKAKNLLPRVLQQARDPLAHAAAYLLLSRIIEAQMHNVTIPHIERSIARSVRTLARALD